MAALMAILLETIPTPLPPVAPMIDTAFDCTMARADGGQGFDVRGTAKTQPRRNPWDWVDVAVEGDDPAFPAFSSLVSDHARGGGTITLRDEREFARFIEYRLDVNALAKNGAMVIEEIIRPNGAAYIATGICKLTPAKAAQ